jgi:hypothetical protein
VYVVSFASMTTLLSFIDVQMAGGCEVYFESHSELRATLRTLSNTANSEQHSEL